MSQTRLTNEQRLQVCRHKSQNPQMSQSALASWATAQFSKNITQAGISGILKKRKELEVMTETDLAAKRPRVAHHPQLEEALATWVLQCQAKNVALTGEIIKVKAKCFADRLGLAED